MKHFIFSILLLFPLPLKAETISLGTFKITHYCACVKCCGKNPSHPAYGITASGLKVKEGMIAVDKKVIPLHSKVIIEDITYTATDTGGAIKGKRIDIYCDTHKEALEKGVKYSRVYIVK